MIYDFSKLTKVTIAELFIMPVSLYCHTSLAICQHLFQYRVSLRRKVEKYRLTARSGGVQTLAVFILQSHYPSGMDELWQTFVVRLVTRFRHRDGYKPHYAVGRTFLRNTS